MATLMDRSAMASVDGVHEWLPSRRAAVADRSLQDGAEGLDSRSGDSYGVVDRCAQREDPGSREERVRVSKHSVPCKRAATSVSAAARDAVVG